MKYVKTPLTINEQILRLEQRGLGFTDKKQAASYLQNISYYRFRAYTYPYQDNENPESDHAFIKKNIDFQDIIDLYVFDKRLRNLIFNELEKIEVAVRTELSQTYSICTNDAFWYNDSCLFADDNTFNSMIKDIESDVHRSNEDFIKHYWKKYDTPLLPPSWMTLEVVSFGLLSRIFKNLKKSDKKKQISRYFGIIDEEIFANWLHALSNLRNCCAHHSRIWNRRFPVHMILPYNTVNPFMSKNSIKEIKQNKIFALLSAIKYIVDIISPGNSFRQRLVEILNDSHRLLTVKEMGFPENWEDLPVWK
ncbi:MAG: Abi family protein [Bacteroidales bacterium]|nr:Abi family protein [Bacteroidales bacterium]